VFRRFVSSVLIRVKDRLMLVNFPQKRGAEDLEAVDGCGGKNGEAGSKRAKR
jgi:hypothetical protein